MTDHRTLLERAAFWLEYEGHPAHVVDYDRRGHKVPALVTKADPIFIGWAVAHAKTDFEGINELRGPMNWLPILTAPDTYTI